jgi:GAF domain-containing protein
MIWTSNEVSPPRSRRSCWPPGRCSAPTGLASCWPTPTESSAGPAPPISSPQLAEEDQERLGKGPCRAAFSQRMAIAIHNADAEPDPDGSRSVLRNSGFQAALSVPVELHGGPIGSLDLYSSKPRDWDDSEIGALQAYAGIVANLLGSAAAAHVKGRLAEQLQAALAHGAVIEQAKGALMEREGLDAATAYERLRTAARSSSRKVADVARDLLAGAPFPPTQP